METDPRDSPAYSITEAAHYLGLPVATLRAWAVGRPYATREGERQFTPVLTVENPAQRLLSFNNLVEAHILAAIRRKHGVTLQKIRVTLDYTRSRLNVNRPLIEQQFATDGVSLFVERLGELIDASKRGQLAMREVFQLYLNRVERDAAGLPVKLYPFTRVARLSEQPANVVIDPRIAFGRPVLKGTGVPTAVLVERYKAGESIDALAEDYGTERQNIEEAIRLEIEPRAA